MALVARSPPATYKVVIRLAKPEGLMFFRMVGLKYDEVEWSIFRSYVHISESVSPKWRPRSPNVARMESGHPVASLQPSTIVCERTPVVVRKSTKPQSISNCLRIGKGSLTLATIQGLNQG